MDFRRMLAGVASALLVLSGCRHNQAAHELLERELRWQEDRIYELEAKLQDAERDLDRFRERGVGGDSTLKGSLPPSSFDKKFDARSNEIHSGSGRPDSTLHDPSSPRSVVPPPDASSPVDTNKAPPFQGPPTISPPSVEIPEGLPSNRPAPSTPSTTEPKIVPVSPGTPTTSEPLPHAPIGTVPDATSPSMSPTVPSPTPRDPPTIPPPKNVPPPFKTMSSPKFVPPSARPRLLNDEPASTTSSRRTSPSTNDSSLPNGEPSLDAQAGDGDRRVVEVSLSLATGGVDLDGKPGDDGVRVVLEPRNGQGRIVPVEGGVAIVLIDPAEPGEAGRYARWDFQPNDTSGLYRPASEREGPGLYFELPWPETPPAHSRMRLFVRLTTPDGRTLQTDREVQIRRPGAGEQVRRDTFVPAAPSPVVRAGGGEGSRSPADVSPAATLNWGSSTKGPLPTPSPTPTPTPTLAPALAPTPASKPLSPPPQQPTTTAGPALFPAMR